MEKALFQPCSSPEHTWCPTPNLSPLWPLLSGCRPLTHGPSLFLPLHLCSHWVSCPGGSSCPCAPSCAGMRFPAHQPRSGKAHISHSSVCPLPTPAKCLAHTGNHARVLAGGWAPRSPQGSDSMMPHSHGAANHQHLTGNPISGQRPVKEPGWSHRQRQGPGHSCVTWPTGTQGSFLRALQAPSPPTLPCPAQTSHGPLPPGPSRALRIRPCSCPASPLTCHRQHLLRFLSSVLGPGRPFLRHPQWAAPPFSPAPFPPGPCHLCLVSLPRDLPVG